MKKLLLLSLCLLAVVSANWQGYRWVDDRFNFTMDIPNSWQVDSTTRRRAYANRGDGVTEFYIEVIPANRKDEQHNRTAREVATDRMRGYDSWRYIAGRELTGNERRGAQSAFSVMYGRSILQRATARPIQVIAQEGYFVRGNDVIIVTLITDSDTWDSSKRELLQIWNSLRIR